MSYTPPLDEQNFVHQMAAEDDRQCVDSDIVDAILQGAGAFAVAQFAPLNRTGDAIGARWSEDGVIMPDGFKAAYRAYVDGGWGSLDGPEAYGGQGLPFSLATVVLEDLGSANMAFSLCPMLTVGAIEAIKAHGSDAQRATYLPKLIIHLVLARTPGAPPGTKGISLFLVPKFRTGPDGRFTQPNDVRCVSIEHKLGINASPTAVMTFGDNDDCKGWLIGPEHGGMRAMFTMMNNARLNVGLQGVQIGERATQAALAYARDRVQGGSAIIEHPDVRRMLLRMKSLTEAARALVYSAAGYVDRLNVGLEGAKARLGLLIPLCKAYGTDIGCEVASLGVQVHGGMGFIEETGAAQYYRDIRIAPIYEGTNGIQAADLVGRKLTADGGAAVKALVAEIRADGKGERMLESLADAVERTVDWMLAASSRDRLAGSYPFLEMVSVLACAGLMVKQGRTAAAQVATAKGNPRFLKVKLVTVRYYLDHVVPEALGKEAAAKAGGALFYELDADELAL